ncbi:MAG: amidohydrolase family protein [Microlunatus sp.]|nr:amidohydrolase family protein [Microlunatus sp.]
MRIDAHQHFWTTARGDYHWMPAEGPLHQDWMPSDLAPLNEAAGITGTVVVQAAQTVAETEFLLDLADQPENSIMAVVGWIDLDSADAIGELERLSAHPKLRAIRPMLQDLNDPAWILRPQVLQNLRRLPDFGLAYEVLSYPGHLPYALQAIDEIPEVPVIIDHLSKPVYSSPPPEFWRTWISRFGRRPNTAIKISGMVTEIGPGWTIAAVRPNVEAVIEDFGTDRIMFGSDWPVCLQAADHAAVVTLAEQLVSGLSPAEQESFWSGTARTYYQLDRAQQPGARTGSGSLDRDGFVGRQHDRGGSPG